MQLVTVCILTDSYSLQDQPNSLNGNSSYCSDFFIKKQKTENLFIKRLPVSIKFAL